MERLLLNGNNLSGCIPASLRTILLNDLDNLGLSFCGSSVESPPPVTEDEPSVESPPPVTEDEPSVESPPPVTEDEPSVESPDEPDDELDGSDRAILMVFYRATGGGSAWTGNNWGSDQSIGTWQGVTTNAEGRVTRLVLNNNDLSGSIPAALGQLTKLEQLNLSANQLSGSIPSELGQLTNLTDLRLGRNYLSGPIPSALGNLTNLKRLILYINELSGSISSELGQLTDLTDLRLSANGQLTNLTYLTLSSNRVKWLDSF